MTIIQVDINKLKPYEKNAKIHPEAQIKHVANSIKEFGFVQPIVIDNDSNIIIGHCRLLAAKKLGMLQAPCVMADSLTDKQIKALRLADNKTNESEWDFDLLKDELASLLDFDMEQFGFDFDFDDEKEVVEDDFDGEPPEEPKSKPGDLYRLGSHFLLCGDSTNADDMARLLGGVKVDLIVTDPPYNVNYEGKTKDKLKIENDEMKDEDFRAFLVSAFSKANEHLKPGGAFYIWHADTEGYNFRGACRDVGWNIRQCLIWCKNSMVMGRQDYHWRHEPCLYGWKDGASHLWATDRKQTTILEFDKPQKNKEHPTMKPVLLYDYLIKNNTKGEDVVLDMFAGSGTLLIACEQNGRIAYCMEYDPRYVDVCVNRWEQFTGGKAELISG